MSEIIQGQFTLLTRHNDVYERIPAFIEMLERNFTDEDYPVALWADSYHKPRSTRQNSALHVYCRLLANALNDAGYDMKKVMKPEADIPWTQNSVKEYLWRPIQEALGKEHSTTKQSTKDIPMIYETLNRHLAEKLGVSVPWPEQENR